MPGVSRTQALQMPKLQGSRPRYHACRPPAASMSTSWRKQAARRL